MFYTYSQNNSGGSFDFDKKRGITHFVIVEAESDVGADSIAEGIGIYFNGCEEGGDCPCCGDRWSSAYDGTKEPKIYGRPPTKYVTSGMIWMEKGFEVCVHYRNGEKRWF